MTTDAQRLKDTGFAVDGAAVNGYYTENGIAININSPKALETVVGHEVSHALEGSELYDSLKDAVISYAQSKGAYKSRMDALTKLYTGKQGYETDFHNKMEKELVADLVGEYLFTDADFVSNLSVQNRNLFQKLYDEIKHLLKLVKAGSKEARQLEKIKKLFEETYRDTKNTAQQQDGVKYSLLVKQTNGEETVVNTNNITRDQVLKYMNMARQGQLESYTYFPVRSHTPSAVIATLRKAGVAISDKPLAMQARKARQSQLDEVPYKKNGITVRHHAMNAREILEAIDKLEDPQTIIHQQERTKVLTVDGEKRVVDAPDNFAVFVTLDNGKECVAIIEFDSEIDDKYVIKDGNGDEYHTTVTVFEPDIIRNNGPFDYIEYLLLRGSNQELEIIKESSKTETAHSETHATVSERELPKEMIPHKKSDVKLQLSLSKESGDEQAAGKNTYSQDVALEQADTALPDEVQQQILDLQGRLQEAVQAGDMDEVAYLGKDLYELQHPDEALETGENSTDGEQAVLSDSVTAILGEEKDYLSRRAGELYQEIQTLKKGAGIRASNTLSPLLDQFKGDWTPVKTALLNIRDNPTEVVNPKSAALASVMGNK